MNNLLFWTSFIIIIYVYVGYPAFLLALSLLYKKEVKKKNMEPSVTIIVPAYNEEKIIAQKIENCLKLDYPSSKLEIIVISDCSVDKTDAIVRSFSHRGVILKRLEQRSGKVVTLNKAIPDARGEIIVLCDTNTFFKPDAIRMLVRNFSDDSIGAVSGDVRLINEVRGFAESEGAYYKLERFIQEKESKIASIVCVDGGMYALRKKLYRAPQPNTILDDFAISLSVINQGYRIVYEPEAVALENSPDSFKDEFRRRIRIAAGSSQLLFQKGGMPSLKLPFIVFEYLSHKLLRWLTPFFLIILFFSNIALLSKGIYLWLFFMQFLFYIFALAHTFLKNKLTSMPYYFCLTNIAILMGFFRAIVRRQSAIWQPVR